MLPEARHVASKFATLAHLGAKLANIASSWLQLGPSWCQDAPQQASTWSPRCLPTRILHILAPRGPQSVPRQPQGSIFSYFPQFWDRFWTDFHSFSISLLIEFRNRFCLRCLAFFFKFSSSKFRHGGGLSRACALDICIAAFGKTNRYTTCFLYSLQRYFFNMMAMTVVRFYQEGPRTAGLSRCPRPEVLPYSRAPWEPIGPWCQKKGPTPLYT